MNIKLFLKNNKFYIILVLIAICIGFYFRLKGLAEWPLALDEYYIVKSAQNILKYGIPEWTGGDLYLRGLLYQYCISGLLLLGVKAEFAARIIPVVLNFLALPPLFILAKKINGKLFATIILIVFIFSVWETEFSRFARMYVPFQTIFIWYIFFLYNYIIENKQSSLKWIFILSFLSIFIYEGSIFLVLLNLLPIAWNKETKRLDLSQLLKINFPQTVIAVSIIIFTYFFSTAENRISPDYFPAGYMTTHSHLFNSNFLHIPQILLTTLANEKQWIIPFIVIVGFSLFNSVKIFKTDNRKWYNKLLFILLIIISLLNLFGFLILLLTIFLLLDWVQVKDIRHTEVRFIILSLIINLIFWFLYAYYTSTWYSFFPDLSSFSKTAIIKKIFILLFNYPNNYFEFYRYAVTIPIYSLIFISSTAFVIYKIVKTSYAESLHLRFITFLLLLLILLVCSIDTLLSETRYTFFLYPLVLFIVYSAFKIISENLFKNGLKEKISFVMLALIFFSISGDFNARHLINIDSKEINFRMNYKENMIRHYYPRWDVKTPADIVNKEKKANDVTIIDELNIEFYLNELDYIYVNYDHLRFRMIAIDGGKKERWTNANLIYTNQQLQNLFENTKGNVWFITIHKPHLNEINFKENFKKFLYYTSIDKNIFVYKIPGGLLTNGNN